MIVRIGVAGHFRLAPLVTIPGSKDSAMFRLLFAAARIAIARRAVVSLVLAISAACHADCIQAQNPPQLSAEERAAKLAERDRLLKEAGKLRAAGQQDEAIERLTSSIQLQRALFGDRTTAEAESLEQIALIERLRQHWAPARAAAAEALGIRQTVFGENDWRAINARLLVADIERWSTLTAEQRAQLAKADQLLTEVSRLRGQGKYREALPLALQGLALRRQVLGDVHRATADALNALALLYSNMGEFARAESFYQQAVDIAGKTLGKDHPDFATTLQGLAVLYDNRGDYARAEPLFKQSMEIDKKALGEAHPGYAIDVNNLAALYDNIGDYPRAGMLYKQALEIKRKALGEAHPGYAISLSNLASVYARRGDYEGAESLLKQALEIDEKALGKAHPDRATRLGNLGDVYQKKGDYARAEPLFKQALEIDKQALGESHPKYANDLDGLAGLYHSMGDYARAEPLYKQALEIRRHALGEAHTDFASSLNRLGMLYFRMGDYARAEPLLKQSLEIKRKALGESHVEYAAGLNSLALLYDKMDDYAKAEPLYRQALEITRKVQGESHTDYATGLNNLAAIYDRMGDSARAEPLLKQALEIKRKALGEAHPDYAMSLNNLAVLYNKRGDYARAEPLYRQALEINKNALGEAHLDYATGLGSLGMLELGLNRPADAEKLLRQAVQIARKNLDLTASVQSEQQQLAMAKKVRNHLDSYLTGALAASAAPAEVYTEVAAWKGSVSAQQQLLRARQRALAGDPNLERAQLFAQLDEKTRRLAALTRYAPNPEEAAKLPQEIAALGESLDELQQQLSRLDPDFHRAWAERKISPSKLQQALPTDAALVDVLEFWQYVPPTLQGQPMRRERRVLAFVVRREAPIVCVQLGPSAPLGSLIESWRASFGGQRANDSQSPGRELRRLLWEPLTAHLAGADTVLVSPDGALAQLPWAALPGNQPGTFLIEERAIAVIAIPQMLPELVARGAHLGPPDSLLLAGNINYGGDAGAATDRAGTRAAVGRMREGRLIQFQQLDASQAELSSIEQRYRQQVTAASASTLSGSDATEAAFRAEAPKHIWMHLITHGYFAPDGSTAPAVSPANTAGGKPALAGIGANMEVNAGRCRVLKLIPGGAAIRDGRLKSGDEIVAVAQTGGDWKPTAGKDLLAIVAMTRGPFGTTVQIRVRPHEHPDQEVDMTFVRGALPAQTEPANPGLLSGLVFAGANSPPAVGKDDGILTAAEVSSLDLSKVETVVLSACETGLGQVAGGEGLLGLQRSFQVAGAKTVVASLWKVPDAATSELMQRFYENLWDKRMGKLVALREAQIWMLREGVKRPDLKRGLALVTPEDSPTNTPPGAATVLPPFYWAAFVLSGDWR
jgi:CHAT domain-containing protein/Tfp pilus assembly protein PilF